MIISKLFEVEMQKHLTQTEANNAIEKLMINKKRECDDIAAEQLRYGRLRVSTFIAEMLGKTSKTG